MLVMSTSRFYRCKWTCEGPKRQGCLYAAFGRLLQLTDPGELLHSLGLLGLKLMSGWDLSNRAEAPKDERQAKLQILGPGLRRFAHALPFSFPLLP